MNDSPITIPPAGPSSSGRKFLWFVIFIIALLLGFCALWYWAAGKLDNMTTEFRTNLEQQGKQLHCNEQEVRGFPFRLGLFCNGFSFDDPAQGISINGAALRSAAQLYKPGHVVSEIDSPLNVTFPGLAPLSLDWALVKSSTKVGTDGLKRLSVVGTSVEIFANDAGLRDLLGSISNLQFHARPAPDSQQPDDNNSAIEAALTADQWRIDDGGSGTIPAVDMNLSVKLDRGMDAINQGIDLLAMMRSNGGSGEINEISIRTDDGGYLKIDGPVEIDRAGRISGELIINLDDPHRLVNYASTVFPPALNMLSEISNYLEALSEKRDGVVEIRDLKLDVRKGKVFIGFFPIGEIPRLF